MSTLNLHFSSFGRDSIFSFPSKRKCFSLSLFLSSSSLEWLSSSKRMIDESRVFRRRERKGEKGRGRERKEEKERERGREHCFLCRMIMHKFKEFVWILKAESLIDYQEFFCHLKKNVFLFLFFLSLSLVFSF